VKVRILVPRREGLADRDRLWSYCRPWWQHRFADWPLIEGHHELAGPFNRAAALNTAAELAGDWDVAVIIDADVLVHPPAVRDAVELANEAGRLVIPFVRRHNLSARGTARVIDGYTGPWEPFIARTFGPPHHLQVSSVVAVPRRLWDAVGGFDAGFNGWGLEDTAFAIACQVVAGQASHIEGECWHLHHEASKAEKHGSWTHVRNMARADRYRAAQSLGDVDTIRALVAEGRELEANRVAHAIPRILHRVVPETPNPVAERWWAAFDQLHPDWRLMTHRDPLEPAEWPLTSPHWDRATSGAQLADLVRLEALLRWGGVYVDQDVEPFRPLDPLLGLEAFAAWEDEKVIPNAVLGARPDHPAIRECLELAIERMRISTWEAGPGTTTKVLAGRDDVLLLPPGSFFPVHYHDPERDEKMAGPVPPWTFARHAYWGSWLPAERQRVPAA
jgi:hypothetical protein